VRILERMSDIAIGDVHHGPAAGRRCRYGPTYVLRGLSDLRPNLTTAVSVACVH
jgi:hypothetical protein